jgi:2,4-dienoyl-CoA reductase-like NADH-dependent reductase (Old Yellow Enzyme family)
MPSDNKPYSVETREGYFIQFAELLRPHLKFSKIVVTGGFRTAHGMSDAVAQGATDSKCRLAVIYTILLSGWHNAW